MDYRKTMNRLNSALGKIDVAYEVIAKKYGLTYNALMMVYLIDQTENITQKQICDELHLPKSTVHSILSDFIKQGYANLTGGNNKKEKFVIITESGKHYFSNLLEETQSLEKNVLDTLGDETCDFLTETADIVGELMMSEIVRINDGGAK